MRWGRAKSLEMRPRALLVLLPVRRGREQDKVIDMTANLNPTPTKTVYVLLALGLALGGAALAPTAAAWCTSEDAGDLVVVAGGSGCTYHGHGPFYVEALGQQVYPLP